VSRRRLSVSCLTNEGVAPFSFFALPFVGRCAALSAFPCVKDPVGRIVMGLHGNVVPKTAKNFETICRGGERLGNVDMSYEGESIGKARADLHFLLPTVLVVIYRCAFSSSLSVCYSRVYFPQDHPQLHDPRRRETRKVDLPLSVL